MCINYLTAIHLFFFRNEQQSKRQRKKTTLKLIIPVQINITFAEQEKFQF